MRLKNHEVLVTGGGGFIGSHLVEKLLEEGANVSVFLRYNSRGDNGWIEGFPQNKKDRLRIISGDIQDGDAVRGAVEKAEKIFHLAALIGIPYSYIHPRHVIQTNVLGTFNLLEACRKAKGLQGVVHVSTSEVYGTAQTDRIDESHPLCPQSPYAASKLAADKIAESYQKTFDLPIAIARPFNCFGPRQSARAVIPNSILQCLTREHITLGRTDTVRDYTYVEDTVEGLIKVSESPDCIGETVNLGSGKGHKIQDIVKTIQETVEKENFEIRYDSKRVRPEKSEVVRLVSNSDKAKQIAGWTAKTHFENGIKRTVDWYRSNLKWFKPGKYQV